jgi:3-oxoadipate enol-lactonase
MERTAKAADGQAKVIFEQSGIRTYYETTGDERAPVLLLLHGLGAEHGMWNEQIEPFVGAGLRLVVPDLLAHGKSSKVATLTLDDWSAQINALMASLQIDKFSVAGVSMGGVIAQHHAVHNQDRLEKLIIVDSFSDLRTFVEKLLGVSQVISLPLFKLLGKRIFAAAMASSYKRDFAYRARTYLHERSLEADFGQLLLARRAINRIHVLDRLPEVQVPSLVVVGDAFGQLFVDINEKIANHLPNSRFHVIANSMDPSCLVQPEEFNRLVLDFMR